MGFGKPLCLLYCAPMSGAPPQGCLESFIFQHVLRNVSSMGSWARRCPVRAVPVCEAWSTGEDGHLQRTGGKVNR